MNEHEHDDELDPAADTSMFQAFVQRGDQEQPVQRGKAVGAPFRILTLLGGLVVFALIVWLLFLL